jgi:hypothetical protein
MVSLKIAIYSVYDLCGGQQAVGLHDRPLAMDPMRFKGIQPRTFDRQATDQEADASVPLRLPIVGTNPHTDRPANVPGGLVPQQHQDLFPRGGQPLAEPGEKGGRHMADWTSVDTPQQQGVAVGPQQPIAAQGFGLRVPPGEDLFHQPQGLPLGPAVQGGVGQPAPPGLIGKAQHPVVMSGRQLDQSVTLLFFNA